LHIFPGTFLQIKTKDSSELRVLSATDLADDTRTAINVQLSPIVVEPKKTLEIKILSL
jgi:hypothetical protein